MKDKTMLLAEVHDFKRRIEREYRDLWSYACSLEKQIKESEI